jgi:hypothetical protein
MCQIGLSPRHFLGRTTVALHVSIEAMRPDRFELFDDGQTRMMEWKCDRLLGQWA